MRRAPLVLAGLLAILAFAVRPIVRELDPWLAVQAAVLHDELGQPDPWGRRWAWIKGLHDSNLVVHYSVGPDGLDDYGRGDDLIPDFSFWGWGRHGYEAWSFPPAVVHHNLAEWADNLRAGRDGWAEYPDYQRLWRRIYEDRPTHVLAVLIGWSRELFLGAALLLALAPHLWRQLWAPRRSTHRELVRATILASPLAALAALAGWCWPAAHASALFVVVSRPMACGLSGAAVAFVGVLLFRLSRHTEVKES